MAAACAGASSHAEPKCVEVSSFSLRERLDDMAQYEGRQNRVEMPTSAASILTFSINHRTYLVCRRIVRSHSI
jgi:hypothetical protein